MGSLFTQARLKDTPDEKLCSFLSIAVAVQIAFSSLIKILFPYYKSSTAVSQGFRTQYLEDFWSIYFSIYVCTHVNSSEFYIWYKYFLFENCKYVQWCQWHTYMTHMRNAYRYFFFVDTDGFVERNLSFFINQSTYCCLNEIL